MKLTTILGWALGGFAVLIIGLISYSAATDDEYREELKLKDRQHEQQRRLAVRDTVHLASLATLISQQDRAEDFVQVASDIRLLTTRYPTAPQARALGLLQGTYDSLARLAQQREAIKQRRRQQPDYYRYYPRRSSYWHIRATTDEFGDETNSRYLINSSDYGFSGQRNYQGVNSIIKAAIIVDSAQKISLLFSTVDYHPRTSRGGKLGYTAAYTTSQAITATEPTPCGVAMRDADGRTYQLAATHTLGALLFDEANSETLHQALKRGGKIRFVITESTSPPTTYRFAIDNADDYENYYKELMATHNTTPTKPAAP
jgi:hypothetical protein